MRLDLSPLFSRACLLTFLLAVGPACPQTPAQAPAWRPDLGNGRYRNPVLFADYSDPDAVRVGEDYYLTSSSFSHVPGLPILHSRDLVNWSLIGHALPRLVPHEHFSTPRPGQGVWAPALRHHAGRFWIYYPDPDFGIYLITAERPEGPWSEPCLVKSGKGLIDPCPFWDEDGTAYLIHAWARSRSGISNKLSLVRLTADGRSFDGDASVVIDADQIPGWSTLEGPKLYKRNGYYYVFAPAGGVKTGWQTVFRSRSLRGPFEHRIVLEQGRTTVNGPHQGAWVTTPSGSDWFLHFQDREAYGRIVHLQPMTWRDDWPVMGSDPDGDGRGEPVESHEKPVSSNAPALEPGTGDEFDASVLSRAWQWQANPRPEWASVSERPGWLRLPCLPGEANLYREGRLLLQKFVAPAFTATTQLELTAGTGEEDAGLIVFGYDYAWVGLRRADRGVRLCLVTRNRAQEDGQEKESILQEIDKPSPVHLRVQVEPEGRCRFFYSIDGHRFEPVPGPPFQATPSRWVGAKVGLFATSRTTRSGGGVPEPVGHADFAWFRLDP